MNLDIFKSISKEDIANVSDSIVSKVENGEINPLEANIRAKFIIKCFESVIKKTDSQALNEADKWGKKGNLLGVDFSTSETGDRLDYEEDKEYSLLKKQLKEREERLKMSFKMKEDLVIDGELIPKVSIKSHSSTILKVTIN